MWSMSLQNYTENQLDVAQKMYMKVSDMVVTNEILKLLTNIVWKLTKISNMQESGSL